MNVEEFRRLLRSRKGPRRRRTKNSIAPALEMRLMLDAEPSPMCDYVTEWRFHPSRKWRLDFGWPDFNVALEVHGGVWKRGRHTRPMGFTEDREKMNVAELLGIVVLEATTDQVQSGQALEWLREALLHSMRGGRGTRPAST